MSELVEQVARALEPLVDRRPAIDASASHIRSLQARALACAALSVLEPLREALLWCSRHAGGEIADDASLAELKYIPEVVRLRIEALEREQGWQDIATAPKDGRYILAIYRSLNGYAAHLHGRAFVIRHEGETDSGYDLGWALFPGFGGVPDKSLSAWRPLPDPPAIRTGEAEQ